MDKLELRALAKLNLGLDICGLREDGYHDVKMIMQTVGVYDLVWLEKTQEEGIQVSTNLYYLPTNENNLVYRAAELLMKEFHIKGGLRITLDKHIPVAAGMGGGSADAASVLFGMNQMYGLKLPFRELTRRGARLGADVPFCILRGTMLAEGVGEQLTVLPPCPDCYLLIAKPSFSASTPKVYAKFDELSQVQHPDLNQVIQGLEEGKIRQVAAGMGNVLEQVMIPEYPVIGQLKELMLECGALGAVMSGTGPTVFGIYERRDLARKTARRIKSRDLARQVYVTTVRNTRRMP